MPHYKVLSRHAYSEWKSLDKPAMVWYDHRIHARRSLRIITRSEHLRRFESISSVTIKGIRSPSRPRVELGRIRTLRYGGSVKASDTQNALVSEHAESFSRRGREHVKYLNYPVGP